MDKCTVFINLENSLRKIELHTITSIARYLRGFNDSLLVEGEITPSELRKLYSITHHK